MGMVYKLLGIVKSYSALSPQSLYEDGVIRNIVGGYLDVYVGWNSIEVGKMTYIESFIKRPKFPGRDRG